MAEPLPTIDRLRASLAGRYRIDRELGRGGMATVYLAHDLKHDRSVALKALDPALAAPLAPGRFQREIRLAARLHHPHILAVYESGAVASADGGADILWFTMPYVDGETLRQRMDREGRLPVEQALRIVREGARALDYSHRNGVVHRDIKPENILLTREGDSLIADFGIGRALAGGAGADSDESTDETLTTAGVLVGTPRYMSLEQADGLRLDGRTDIYSLGVVLYEMLAGEPPFAGRTAHSVVAQQLSGPPPSLRALRPDVPPELERVVLRMLATDREQRTASAGALLEALESFSQPSGTAARTPGPGARSRWSRRRVAVVVGAAAAALAAIAVYRRQAARPAALDQSLVAVAPFDVADSRLSLWREGLVDLLARNLDGAGPIRAVAPTVVIRRWSGRADRPSAAALGLRTGAGLALYGSLLSSGADTVRLRVTLLDAARERPLGEWEVADASDRMDRLTDSVTVLVLEGLGQTRPVGAVRSAGLRRTSSPALKAFLQGEQYYRRGQWDSSLVEYQRAIAADTGFAPALLHAGAAAGWIGTAFDSLSTAYMLRAGADNHGLPPRDSLLIASESLFAALLEAGPLGVAADREWTPRLGRLLRTLDYATKRYPDDPEAWFLLGDVQTHLGAFAGRSYEQQLDAYDRAIALDSGFAPPYFHAIEISAARGSDAMRRYLRPYLRLQLHDGESAAARLVEQLLDGPGDSAQVASLSRGVPDEVLLYAMTLVDLLPDSAERLVSLDRVIAGRAFTAAPWSVPGFSVSHLGGALMSRGHLRAAVPLTTAWSNSLALGEAMLLGAAQVERGEQIFRQRLADPLTPRLMAAFPWWAARRDTASLRLAAARAAQLAQSAPDSTQRALTRYAAASAAAYVALSRSDTTAALAGLLALPAAACPACYLDRLILAQLLTDRHRDREAWELLQGESAFSTLDPTATEVLWALLRARVGERVGERDRALRSYAWVAGMWRNADPELRPYVQEARDGLVRLGGERPERP